MRKSKKMTTMFLKMTMMKQMMMPTMMKNPLHKLINYKKVSEPLQKICLPRKYKFNGKCNTFNDPDDQLESDDDDEYAEDIFKKLESSFNDDITFIHPQTTEVNNNELKNLSTIVRNKYGLLLMCFTEQYLS